MTKHQQVKLDAIRGRMDYYLCAPVFTAVSLSTELLDGGAILAQISNNGPWYETQLCITFCVYPRGKVLVSSDVGGYAKSVLGKNAKSFN